MDYVQNFQEVLSFCDVIIVVFVFIFYFMDEVFGLIFYEFDIFFFVDCKDVFFYFGNFDFVQFNIFFCEVFNGFRCGWFIRFFFGKKSNQIVYILWYGKDDFVVCSFNGFCCYFVRVFLKVFVGVFF